MIELTLLVNPKFNLPDFAHTQLDFATNNPLFEDFQGWVKIAEITGAKLAPQDFACYRAVVPDGSKMGEHCYGVTRVDSYDHLLFQIKAEMFLKYWDKPRAKATLSPVGKAALAYLKALPGDTLVTLYWS